MSTYDSIAQALVGFRVRSTSTVYRDGTVTTAKAYYAPDVYFGTTPPARTSTSSAPAGRH